MSIFTKLSSLRNKRSASSSSLNQGSVGDLQPSAKHKRTSAIDPRLVAAKALLDTMKAPYTNYFFKSTSTLESNSDRYSQYFLYFGPFVAIYLLDTFPSVSADLSVYMPGVLGPEKQGWSPIKTSSEKVHLLYNLGYQGDITLSIHQKD